MSGARDDIGCTRLRGLSRREALGIGLAAAGAVAARRLLGQPPAAAGNALSAGPGLVIRNARPLDAEAPLEALRTWQTANEQFFVRSHFGPPTDLPDQWTLTIDGEVERPVTLSLGDLRRLGSVSQAVTVECAGNGRGLYPLANTSGVQWEGGAVSTAVWTCVPLGAVLERPGLKPQAQHLWMEAADRAPLPAVPKFLRSIPVAVGLDGALLAYEMNGEPLPLLHGGPLRLVVPGWFGMASTKWLTRIHARGEVSDNHFMARGYRYGDGSPVEQMRVKSLITRPLAGARVSVGRVRVTGTAWTGAGGGGITTVEVSADGGRTWQAARLTGPEHPAAWRTWEYEFSATAPGPHAIRARAADRSGAVQPGAADPNPGGYGNNSIHEVRFDVVRP